MNIKIDSRKAKVARMIHGLEDKIHREYLSHEDNLVKFKSKIPSQEVTGPGIIGKKLPTIPIRQSRSPIISNIISN